jgi:hypothetical protein
MGIRKEAEADRTRMRSVQEAAFPQVPPNAVDGFDGIIDVEDHVGAPPFQHAPQLRQDEFAANQNAHGGAIPGGQESLFARRKMTLV